MNHSELNIKPRILLVLSSKEYIHNFLMTSALDGIENTVDMRIAVPADLIKYIPSTFKSISDPLKNGIFSENENQFYFYTDILRRRNRDKSISFNYRDRRITSWSKVFKSVSELRVEFRNTNHFVSKSNKYISAVKLKVIFLLALLRIIEYHLKLVLRKKYLIRLLSLDPIFFFIKKRLELNTEAPRLIREYINKNEFSQIFLASSAFEPISIHLATAQQNQNWKFIMIVDNWDNLSSKTILWKLPNYVATWGLQSSVHAREIQGFSQNQIFEVGSARFNDYLELRDSPINSIKRKRYVLFVGSFLSFDEIKCLIILNKEIRENPKTYSDLKIIYRPHPFSQIKKLENLIECENIIIDDQILEQYSSKTETVFEHNHVGNLIRNADFVVGGLTSVIIEASILGKKYLALTHREKLNLTSPHRVYKSYEHFKKIDSLPNLFLCDMLEKLPIQFRSLLLGENLLQSEIDINLSYFYDLNPSKFAEKMIEVIRVIEAEK